MKKKPPWAGKRKNKLDKAGEKKLDREKKTSLSNKHFFLLSLMP
jgi:hypothetical protein